MAKKLKSKPLNLNKTGCSPMSSNCIIWQGPEIPCLSLCKGDNITQVIYDLAINFCDLYEQLSPETYNIECLNLDECNIKVFKDLFQAIIDKVCFLEAGGCNTNVEIEIQEDGSFKANVTNGTAPYTYLWTPESVNPEKVDISNPTLQITNASLTNIGSPNFYASLIKVKVTDANGCIATAYKMITYLD